MDYSDTTRFRVLDGGAVYSLEQGKIIAHLPGGKYAITKENSRAMLERKKQIAQISQLRGLARRAGVDVDNSTLEEIAAGAGTAIENLTAHMYDTFMKSNNVRGLAEAYKTLTAPLVGEKDEREIHHVHEIESSDELQELIRILREAIPSRIIIDG